ncbi:hypothetical protein DP939_37415 [Spongiactinospora rosea]|uniref:YitH/HolE acetyltransferase (GNAT) domain-containing protein n=1 Tax=Spongiactinospora rosea TaxID=2248750 RepID=A0A366LNL4_9ACTN|nr:hypothetical protein [Spongiactinospora rosea]RBQ15083.1 hypothetical protein DP939_37415 [Spongiactinospora rosea]
MVSAPPSCSGFRVVDGASGIAGTAASGRTRSRRGIGPVIATGEAIAKILIADLAAGVSGAVRMDVGRRHTGLASWAGRHGLAHAYDCPIMA